jgi:hypothetical protein
VIAAVDADEAVKKVVLAQKVLKQPSESSVLGLPVPRIRNGSMPAAVKSSSGTIEQKNPMTLPPSFFHVSASSFRMVAVASLNFRNASDWILVSTAFSPVD